MFWKRRTYTLCFLLLALSFYNFSIIDSVFAAHDVAVTKIGFEEQTVELDVVFLTVTVEVQNKGSIDKQNVPITVYVGNEIIAQDTIPYLPAGTIFNISYDWVISAKAIPYKSNLRAEIGFMEGRDEYIDKDGMSKDFTLTEEDGKVVIRYSVSVHKWIVRQAVKFLEEKYKGKKKHEAFYDEFFNRLILDDEGNLIFPLGKLVEGAEDEDDAVFPNFPRCPSPPDVDLRYLRHFYRPTDDPNDNGFGKGYYFKESEYGIVVASLLTGCLPPHILNELPGFQDNAFIWGWDSFINSHDYTDAKEAYKSGSINDAYYKLGHVLHLIADVSLPEHTHLEYHGPGDAHGYEKYVSSKPMTNDKEDAPLPPDIKTILYDSNKDLEHIPPNYRGNDMFSNITTYNIVRYNTLKEYIVNLAKLSYYRNRYQAGLPLVGPPSGPLTQMFPVQRNPNNCGEDSKWEIPGVGCLGKGAFADWWDTKNEPYEGGNPGELDDVDFYYLERTIGAIPQKYKTFWDPDQPDGSNDKYEGDNTTEQVPLARLYARDLIPLAIRYVAGAIDLFWYETHPDLYATAKDVGCCYAPGEQVQIPVTVHRDLRSAELTDSTFVHAKLYWSTTEPTPTWEPPSDQWLWKSNDGKPGRPPDFPVDNLNPNGYAIADATITIPNEPDGTYYIIAYADAPTDPDFDPNGYYDEGDESNNWTAYQVTISGGEPLPDPPVIEHPGRDVWPGEIIAITTPTFQWQGVAGTDSYGLYINKHPPDGTLEYDSQKEGDVITGTSFTLPSGYLNDGVQYRWNMNSHSDAGWGTKFSNLLFFKVDRSPTNNPPPWPENLHQFKSDGITKIPAGGTTNESPVVFKGWLSDPDGDDVQLEIELSKVNVPFTDNRTHLPSPLVESGNNASITVSGLTNGEYHWQGRTVDSKGVWSKWRQAGDTPDPNDVDLIVNVTSQQPPTVTTDSASGITKTSVVLNGTVNPNGSTTTGWFEWGVTIAYGNRTPDVGFGSGTTPAPISWSISGLTPDTEYHFRIVARNDAGTSNGIDRTFKTTLTRTLTVASINPSSGVPITVSPNDKNGLGVCRSIPRGQPKQVDLQNIW